jgi:hypothetical protein
LLVCYHFLSNPDFIFDLSTIFRNKLAHLSPDQGLLADAAACARDPWNGSRKETFTAEVIGLRLAPFSFPQD